MREMPSEKKVNYQDRLQFISKKTLIDVEKKKREQLRCEKRLEQQWI